MSHFEQTENMYYQELIGTVLGTCTVYGPILTQVDRYDCGLLYQHVIYLFNFFKFRLFFFFCWWKGELGSAKKKQNKTKQNTLLVPVFGQEFVPPSNKICP